MRVTKSHSLRHLVAPDSGVDPLVGYSNIVIYIQMTLNTSHSISYLSTKWRIFLPSREKYFFISKKKWDLDLEFEPQHILKFGAF